MQLIASVLLDSGIEKPLDYLVPSNLQVERGMRVKVPLQNREVTGTILDLKQISEFKKLKEICQLTEAVLPRELFELGLWIAKYYVTPAGRVLRAMMPPSVRKEMGHQTQKWVRASVSLNELRSICEEKRLKSPIQAKVLDLLLQAPKGLFLSEILEKADVSQSPVQTLVKQKILELLEVATHRSPLEKADFFPTKHKKLSEEQGAALGKIAASLEREAFQTHLLYGVTGSGKTEVYLQAIDAALKNGKSALYLVPEIALTSQTIERLQSRFQQEIAVLHHRLSEGERHDAWHAMKSGKIRIALGARSAIFSPLQNLGLIIVDEEHEPSYKQSDESPKYHARDVAVMRGKLNGATVVLGSATPSLESFANAVQGKYVLSKLQSRPEASVMPEVQLVDMQREYERNKGYTLFSDPLIKAMKARIEKGEQTLLFLNRRGYHTSAQCMSCGKSLSCPHCDLTLTYHLGSEILACHLCDYRISPPRICPHCQSESSLKFKGAGTEMVERALHALLPEVRTLRLDADTTRHKGSHEKIFKQFRAGKADVLIGTQMIAKGLHLPMVTLVGVIGIDGSLSVPDFRAGEYAFQMLMQISGRSGRGALKGQVIVQTQLIDHPVIQWAAAHDYDAFFAEEYKTRQLFDFPPFTHLVKLTFAGSDAQSCENAAKTLREKLIEGLPKSVEIHPVIPCGYAKIKGLHRFQCLIKSRAVSLLLEPLARLTRETAQYKLSIDVDPLTTYF